MDDYVCYDSPINVITTVDSILKSTTDDHIFQAVLATDIDVDKEKLISALKQDRERYEEAYRRGYKCGYEQALNYLKETSESTK